MFGFSDGEISRYRAEGWWSGRTLPAELVAAADAHPEAVALVTDEGRWTYAELHAAAQRAAHGFGETGLAVGDCVLFQMGNVAETVISYLACLMAGLKPVCTLPQHGEREIRLLAEHLEARGLLVQGDFRGGQALILAEKLIQDELFAEVIVFRGPALAGARDGDEVMATSVKKATLPYESLDPEQIAVFQLSGGTTGLPKIAPRLHEEYAYNARCWAETMGWGVGSVVLYALPLMHNAGVQVALQPALLSGATLVLVGSADAGVILDAVEAHRPDAFPLVPPALAIRLLEHPRSREVGVSRIKDFIVGGQKLDRSVAERLRDELGIHVRQKFGMAEGMFMVTPRDASEAVRFDTVGGPISVGDEVRILKPGSDEQAGPGELGELCVRGPYTIRGYYRADAHNAAVFTSDGFYRSGDLVRRHLDVTTPTYSIEGRIKDVINRGAEKIHAEEVEECLLRDSRIVECAVVAMPDRVLGERACAYVVLADPQSSLHLSDLLSHLETQGLSKFKWPERLEIRDQLPLTNVGKVAKQVLREDVQRLLDESSR